MKKIKDRNIRISNIPNSKVIYQNFSKYEQKFSVLVFLSVIMLFFKVNILSIFIFLSFVYYLLSQNEKIVFEIREDFMLSYLDDDFVEIIYFDEIENYQFKIIEAGYVELIVLTNDEKINKFIVNDKKVCKNLDKLIGEKRVGK